MYWDAIYNLYSDLIFSGSAMFPIATELVEYELFLQCLTGVTMSLYCLIPLIAVYLIFKAIIRCFLWD